MFITVDNTEIETYPCSS